MVKKKSKERRKCRVNSHGVPMMMSVKQHSAIYRVHGGPSVWSACFMCFRAFYDQIICENHTTPKSYPFIQKFWYFQYCFSEKSRKSRMILYMWLQKTYAFDIKKILLAIPELRMFLFKHESTDRKGIFEGHICATQLRERERERRISL